MKNPGSARTTQKKCSDDRQVRQTRCLRRHCRATPGAARRVARHSRAGAFAGARAAVGGTRSRRHVHPRGETGYARETARRAGATAQASRALPARPGAGSTGDAPRGACGRIRLASANRRGPRGFRRRVAKRGLVGASDYPTLRRPPGPCHGVLPGFPGSDRGDARERRVVRPLQRCGLQSPCFLQRQLARFA